MAATQTDELTGRRVPSRSEAFLKGLFNELPQKIRIGFTAVFILLAVAVVFSPIGDTHYTLRLPPVYNLVSVQTDFIVMTMAVLLLGAIPGVIVALFASGAEVHSSRFSKKPCGPIPPHHRSFPYQ